MSNNFKFYINSYNYEKLENELKYVYVFIKNIYFENSEFISTEDLNENYSNDINSFIESKLYTDYFNDLFNDLDKIYINEFNPKMYFLNENIYGDGCLVSPVSHAICLCRSTLCSSISKLRTQKTQH